MPFTPLLPQSKGQGWPQKTTIGVHAVMDADYQRNLCEDYYDASPYGTPSPLAYPIVFAAQLAQYLSDAQTNSPASSRARFAESFALWCQLVKGLYLGCVTLRSVDMPALRDLGRVIAAELPAGFSLKFLVFNQRVIGMTYPGIGLVPGARLDQTTLRALRQEIEEHDIEKASEYFGAWARSFVDYDCGSLRFYPLLLRLADAWSPDRSAKLPLAPERLFDLDQGLWLTKEGELQSAIAQPALPRYRGTPIVCEHCGNEISYDAGVVELNQPSDCRCGSCQRAFPWLEPYASWLRFDEERATFLINAFDGSPVHEEPYRRYVTVRPDGVDIRTGRALLRVRGMVLAEAMLKCTRLTFFTDGERVREPDLPFRGEYYGLAKLARGRPPRLDRTTGDYVVHLDVPAWNTSVVLRYAGREIQHEEALLLSWPDFEAPNWNAYYYALDALAPMNMAGIRLRVLARNGTPRLLDSSRGQLTKPCEAFEIVFAPDGVVQGHAGIFCTRRDTLTRGSVVPVTFALDYGTSASSAWYKVGDDSPKALRFSDLTETLIPNRALSDTALQLSSWLPTYRLDDPDTALRNHSGQLDHQGYLPEASSLIAKLNHFIPAELIVASPVSAQTLAAPLAGYRICHVYADRPSGEVLYELKTLGLDGDPQGRFNYELIVQRYLETFLVLSLATILKHEPQAGYLQVRATLPLAFSDAKRRAYEKCLGQVLSAITALTGFTANTLEYLDESRAAAYSAAVPPGLTLVIDMGGGTTDIGVFEQKDGIFEPIYVESLLYGANAFLRMLADRAAGDLFPKPTEPHDRRMLWLLREIRLRGFDALVTTHYHANPRARAAMLDLLQRFYAPVARFVCRLFEALAVHRNEERDYRRDNVAFYLVGNGWALADAIEAPGGGARGHLAVMKRLLESEGFTNLIPVAPAFDADAWPGPKSAVGYGAVKADRRVFITHARDDGDGRGVRSIAGFDFAYADGRSSPPSNVKWHQRVPYGIPHAHLMPILDSIDIPREWGFIRYAKGSEVLQLQEVCRKDIHGSESPVVTRSTLARFIENIYLNQLVTTQRV